MTLEEFLDRASSAEITEAMAYDLLAADPDYPGMDSGRPLAPMPTGAARRIRLDDPNVLDTLDKYWPPV